MPKQTHFEGFVKPTLPSYEPRELMSALIHSVVSQVSTKGKSDTESARIAVEAVRQVIKGEVRLLLAKSDIKVNNAQAEAYKQQMGGNKE